MTPPMPAGDAALYDETYFARHCGSQPMRRDMPERLSSARLVAARIAETLRPKRVFEAGCAIGLLAEALWDQGVVTHGRDLSHYALAQAREGIQPFLMQGCVTEPIEGSYDLVIALDVLDHLEERKVLQALRHLAAAAPQLLFAVPSGKGNPVYQRTVRPLRWWLERLAEAGLAPVSGFDASFIGPHALLAEHSTTPVDPNLLVAFEALLRNRAEAQQSGVALLKMREELASNQAQLAQARAASEALRGELAGIRVNGDRLRQALHARDEQAAAKQHEIQLLKEHTEKLAGELLRRNEIEILIQQLDGQASDLRCQKEALDGQARDLRCQKEALNAAILDRDLVLGSTIWRMTAPLRAILAPLSRLRRRP